MATSNRDGNSANTTKVNTTTAGKRHKGTRSRGSGTDFVKKLFQMLEENTFHQTVHWSDTGDSFIITDTNEFTKTVLPTYFKHSNFASFVRQLNKYDFHKVKFSHDQKQRYKLDNIWEFKHPMFAKHQRAALDNIKRKVPVKRETENGLLLASRSDFASISQFRNLQDRMDFLEKDNRQLHSELSKMRTQFASLNGKYNSLVATLLTSRTINESFTNSITTLAKAITSMGVQLPPLNLPFEQNSHPSPRQRIQQQQQQQQRQQQQTRQQKQQAQQRTQQQQQSPQQPQSQQPQSNQQSSQQTNRQSTQPSRSTGSQTPQQSITVKPPHVANTLSATQRHQRILARPKGSSLHVLLVEDDDVCIQLCKRFLLKYGCTVVVVKDGLAAISAVEKVKFDLVLMDIVMPNLDGASATSVIRSFDSDTPIIAMTGNYQKEDLMTYLAHGMTDILAKPFTSMDLYMILEKHQMGGRLKRGPRNADTRSVIASSPTDAMLTDELIRPNRNKTRKSSQTGGIQDNLPVTMLTPDLMTSDESPAGSMLGGSNDGDIYSDTVKRPRYV